MKQEFGVANVFRRVPGLQWEVGGEQEKPENRSEGRREVSSRRSAKQAGG